MTLLDPAAQSASLDNDYGATKGPNAPASLEVALFTDDPLLGGVELAATGGYARVVVPNDGTTWPAAASAGSKTSAQVSFGTSTDAWSDVAAWFVLFDHADGVTRWDAQELTDVVVVDTSGTEVTTSLTVYYESTGA
jgi:hypothetical protein